MQVVQVLKCAQVNTLLTECVINTSLLVDEQVQNIESLPANLQSSVDPFQCRHPKEFGTLQLPEKVRYPHFGELIRWAVL
jgi:hypothetical protein